MKKKNEETSAKVKKSAPVKEKAKSPSKGKNHAPPKEKSVAQLREKRRRIFASTPETPAFQESKSIYRRVGFRKQFRLFRESGLGRTDSFFNALYIVLTERSIDREEGRLQSEGKDVSAQSMLEHHGILLRALSFFPRAIGAIGAWFASFWKKDRGEELHRSRFEFFQSHRIHFITLLLALLAAGFVIFQLCRPVVLRAEIDGKVIGIVENKHLVDSAVNELEDNVEIILGKSFHFPHEIRYSFARSFRHTLTEKSKISDHLYSYLSDYICTAGGLYVDEVLVAVCENEEMVNQGLEDFINANASGAEAGIFNSIRVVTQAYPTECILSYEEYQQLLKEMTVPLEERKRETVSDSTVLSEVLKSEEKKTETETAVPAMALVADTAYVPEEKKTVQSNYPQPIGDLKLELYTLEYDSQEIVLPYETVYAESASHYTTMADTTTRGVNGKAQVDLKIYYVNGKEVRREVTSQRIIKQPVNRVVSIGTKILPEELGLRGQGSFIVPRVGYVSHYYGPREDGFHRGWDIPGDEGDNLYATASGRVVVAIGPDGFFAENNANHYGGYGYCVVIEHADGYSSMYAHCSEIFVTLGQEVKQGEKIAEVGNTGWSEGDHVHFEIMKNSQKLDPALYLYGGNKTIYD